MTERLQGENVITPADEDYRATKRIKQGFSILENPFDELAGWIASMWQVTVLNVIYAQRNSLHAPRLNVVFEHIGDTMKFHAGVNYDPDKQNAIKQKFLNVIANKLSDRFDVNGLFVVFSAFAPIALQEADSLITKRELKTFQERIADPDLWEIFRCLGSVTFFFYTDDQVKRRVAEGKKTAYSKMYFHFLKPHDEFNYLNEEDFAVAFDSKQNLDENYAGSLFYYSR
jgi:hypothetical protein